jgi:hypothetical protein
MALSLVVFCVVGKGDEPDLGKDQVLDEISNGDKKVHQGYAGLACLCIPKWEPGELVQ